MPGLEIPHLLSSLAGPGGLFGYIGPGADLSLIPYFLAMLAFLGTAFSAIFLWPIHALLRKIRGNKEQAAPPAPAEEVPAQAEAAGPTES